jgi:hypothetical protein
VEVFEFIADVEANDGSAHFRAPVKEPFNAITFKPPAIGQQVKVKLHAKDQTVRFDAVTTAPISTCRACPIGAGTGIR